MSPGKIRVLCVDDHAFLVEGLKARMALEKDVDVVARLPSADELTPTVERLKPDVVLLDIEMPGRDPFEAADDLRRLAPNSKVVFLSAYIRDHYVSAAVKAGAWGYFCKSDEPAAIVDGIRKVMRGEFTFSPSVAERIKPTAKKQSAESQPAPTAKLELLTDREQEVLRMIGRGMSRVQIAETLSRSPKTVDGHRERIMNKLGIHTGPELIRFAIREGLAEA